jgi:hypothetical protein
MNWHHNKPALLHLRMKTKSHNEGLKNFVCPSLMNPKLFQFQDRFEISSGFRRIRRLLLPERHPQLGQFQSQLVDIITLLLFVFFLHFSSIFSIKLAGI